MSAGGLARLGVRCPKPALGMASLGINCAPIDGGSSKRKKAGADKYLMQALREDEEILILLQSYFMYKNS